MYKKASELNRGDVLIQRYNGTLVDVLDVDCGIDTKGNPIVCVTGDTCSFTIPADEVVEYL